MAINSDGNPVDFSLAVVGAHSSTLDVSTAKTISKPAGATGILIQAITKSVRFTLDGSTPTVSHGFQIAADAAPVVIPVPGAAIKVIEVAATAVLQYQWTR